MSISPGRLRPLTSQSSQRISNDHRKQMVSLPSAFHKCSMCRQCEIFCRVPVLLTQNRRCERWVPYRHIISVRHWQRRVKRTKIDVKKMNFDLSPIW
uniref:Uncharacterized protein n=1 Tax=Anopheles atroparvus TaxID=41427 RepID=A0AAG5CZV9_ANOAO